MILYFIFILTAVAAEDLPVVTFSVDNAMPMEGDTVTFTCEAENLPLTSFIQMDRLSDSGSPLKIGLNGNKDPVIDSLTRYTMANDIIGDVLKFTMVITGRACL